MRGNKHDRHRFWLVALMLLHDLSSVRYSRFYYHLTLVCNTCQVLTMANRELLYIALRISVVGTDLILGKSLFCGLTLCSSYYSVTWSYIAGLMKPFWLFLVEEFKDITNSSRTSSTHHNSESEILMMHDNIILYNLLCIPRPRLADVLENHTDWSLYFDRVTSCGVL